MKTCTFNQAWSGLCKNTVEDGQNFCADHKDKKCTSCGAPATHSCPETQTLVCGAYLCDQCEHRIAPDGTTSGGRHVRRSDQEYAPWFTRKEMDPKQLQYFVGIAMNLLDDIWLKLAKGKMDELQTTVFCILIRGLLRSYKEGSTPTVESENRL